MLNVFHSGDRWIPFFPEGNGIEETSAFRLGWARPFSVTNPCRVYGRSDCSDGRAAGRWFIPVSVQPFGQVRNYPSMGDGRTMDYW